VQFDESKRVASLTTSGAGTPRFQWRCATGPA
jgi:hypothetical protein